MVSMKIVLSKPRQVKWMKGSETISADDERFRASVSDSGLEHTLTISNISTEDNGVFTAEVDDKDYGCITSSSTITVKGNACLHSVYYITRSLSGHLFSRCLYQLLMFERR